ncbi:alpha-mannosidase [Vulcanisaeta thermophila]|uniref:alpha-mannosidase n=1 Tax=Vulcanisaeta thermophila TaxID=867917 RepID=UPI0008536CE5|nr:glycoside hydrolase family 38 C-terminal domain-containing protein [Vulcanisaeta thermophila]
MSSVFTRDLGGVRTKLFYLEAASLMGVEGVSLDNCGGVLCGSVDVKGFGEPWLFVDVVGEGTLGVDGLQYAVFSYGEGGESRWVRVSPGRHSITLSLSSVRMFGERRVEYRGTYLVYREPLTFNFVLKAKLLLDVAEAFEDLRRDYLEILNRALDRFFLDSVAAWQLRFAVKAHLVSPPWFVRSLFDYYDEKELTHLVNPDFKKLSEEAREALEVLERGIEELRVRRGPRGLVHVAGHAHIDLGWLWGVDVTKQKVRRTLINVMSLMSEYPELVFLISNVAYLKWVRDEDPQLFSKVRDLVRSGRIIPVCGCWVEFDANLPGGESLVRQFLYGQRFLLREFGRTAEVGWLPDTFGFPATLPQILRKSGIRVFFEHKLYWNTVNRFPYSVFLWEGVDGTVIPTVNYATYGADLTPTQIARAWNDHTSPELPAFLPFGKGDGGGGPTWLMLERYRVYRDLPGLPRLVMGGLGDLINRLTNDDSLPRWRGELYLEIHRGVYSNGVKLKQLVRRLETRLRELEELSVVFNVRRSYEDYWHTLLEAEYHDPMGATSTSNVYNEVVRGLEEALGRVEGELMNLLRDSLGSGDYVTIVNTLPWPRVGFVELKTTLEGLPAQKLDGKYLVRVMTNPLGYVSFKPGKPSVELNDEVTVEGNSLENSMLRVTVDNGVLRVFDKEAQRWAVRRGYIVACEDMPSRWDGWDIEGWYRRVCRELSFEGVEVLERGPLRGCLGVNYSFRRSRVRQVICLYAGDRIIEVRNEVDWRERLVLLKAFYELGIFGHSASFEAPYGVVERPTRPSNSWEVAKFEVPSVKWVDVYDPDYGVAIFNDGRQGYSVEESTVGITLLRSPIYPNPFLDYGHLEFTYALYPHPGDWRRAEVPRRAYEFNQPLIAIEGTAGGAKTFISIDNPAVMLEALKWGEDGGIIMRVWESYGVNACTRVDNWLGVREAEEVDLLELNGQGRLSLDRLCLRPFEIKTILIKQ